MDTQEWIEKWFQYNEERKKDRLDRILEYLKKNDEKDVTYQRRNLQYLADLVAEIAADEWREKNVPKTED